MRPVAARVGIEIGTWAVSGRCPCIVSGTEGMGARDVCADAVGCADHAVMFPPTFGEIGVQHRLGSEGVMHITVDDCGFLLFGCFCFRHRAMSSLFVASIKLYTLRRNVSTFWEFFSFSFLFAGEVPLGNTQAKTPRLPQSTTDFLLMSLLLKV